MIRLGKLFRFMPGAEKTHANHGGGVGRRDSGSGILDDDTFGGLQAEPLSA